MNKYRTHHCGEVRKEHIGQRVRLAGWVDTIRDHGGVAFVDLRDHYGVTQVVIHDEDLIRDLGREFVVQAEGVLRARDPETVNPKIETGQVELKTDDVQILSRVLRPLPFDVGDSLAVREDVRLKYRFLDLRNPEVHRNMMTRAAIIKFLRVKMEELGFTEIQTPILTSSSPEGARDYLVPSRKHRGMFYALPQAPQQFKQLLMTAGFDKYYQIAACFRDEDARGAVRPGEFYQLDFEMCFATQEDVFDVTENVLFDTFAAFAAPGMAVSPAPFPRIPYNESMMKYGTDQPDLRNPLIIQDLSAFFADVEFAAFKGKPVRGIKAPGCVSAPKSFFEKMLAYAMEIGMKGLGYISVTKTELKGPIVKFLSENKQNELIKMLDLKENDTLFFICDAPLLVDRLAGQIRQALGQRLDLIDQQTFEFCFITDYPMYGVNEQTGKIEFTHNPFSMPQGEMEALDTLPPLDVKAYQYDIVCNGVELSSGAVRNHRPDIMAKAFAIAGYTQEDIEQKFPALFNAFHYGAPPHAGMAPGVDRIVRLLTGMENLREIIPFPMNNNAQDLLMNAPGPVTETQLREAHIKLR